MENFNFRKLTILFNSKRNRYIETLTERTISISRMDSMVLMKRGSKLGQPRETREADQIQLTPLFNIIVDKYYHCAWFGQSLQIGVIVFCQM